MRRHATAIVRIIVESKLCLNLAGVLAQAKMLVIQDGFTAVGQHAADLLDFIVERLRYYGRTVHGLRDDVIQGVIKFRGSGVFDMVDLLNRMKALQAITVLPEFDPLMVGFKRAHRLVEKEKWSRDSIDPSLYQHPTEEHLYRVLEEFKQRVPALIAQGDYAKALDGLVRMRPAIDGFFEGVMVNADDPALRANRLSLLYAIDQLFLSFADFSQIVVQGT